MSFNDLETTIIFLLSLVKSVNIDGGIWFKENNGSCCGSPRNSVEKTFCNSSPGDFYPHSLSITTEMVWIFPLEIGLYTVVFESQLIKKTDAIKKSFLYILYSSRALIPGRVFPSRLSSMAPPPVET